MLFGPSSLVNFINTFKLQQRQSIHPYIIDFSIYYIIVPANPKPYCFGWYILTILGNLLIITSVVAWIMQQRQLDAILCVSPAFTLPKTQTFAPLKKQPIGLISSPDHHKKNAPYILYNRKAWGGQICWNTLINITKTPRILCELDALETIAIMVQRGLGQAVVPKWGGLMQRFGDLEFKRIGNEHRELGLLCRTHQFDHPALNLIHSAMR